MSSQLPIFIQTLKTEDIEENWISEAFLKNYLKDLVSGNPETYSLVSKSYVDAADATKLSLTGGTLTGDLAMSGKMIKNIAEPTDATDASSKQYVDTLGATKLSLTGGALTGDLGMGGKTIKNIAEPTDATDASSKQYVDMSVISKLPLAGGALTGDLEMGGNKIKNIKDPSDASDASSKRYVDTSVASKLPLAGGTMTGEIDMSAKEIKNLGYPTTLDSATTKAFVDTKLSRAGGLMTGDIDMGENEIKNLKNPSADASAVTKSYADNIILSCVKKTGDTITGDLVMSGKKIKNIAEPTDGSDVSSKQYVDTAISSVNINLPTVIDARTLQVLQEVPHLPVAGGKMGGNIDMFNNMIFNLPTPVSDKEAATRGYVDMAINGLTLSKFITTDIDVKVHKIINLAPPTEDSDVATKKYVDEAVKTGTVTLEVGETNLDMKSHKIVNLGMPSGSGDAVTKAYLETRPHMLWTSYPLIPPTNVDAANQNDIIFKVLPGFHIHGTQAKSDHPAWNVTYDNSFYYETANPILSWRSNLYFTFPRAIHIDMMYVRTNKVTNPNAIIEFYELGRGGRLEYGYKWHQFKCPAPEGEIMIKADKFGTAALRRFSLRFMYHGPKVYYVQFYGRYL
nr:hypothetical protein [Abalone asfa-like virus]